MPAREIYLNHAGTSWPKPAAVTDAVRTAMALPPSEWSRLFEEAHHAIAAFFGVGRPDQILLTPGCTSALAVAVSDAVLAPGAKVLTTHWEHHGLHRPLLKRAAAGAPLEYLPALDHAPRTATLDLDWLAKALAGGDVGLVAMTAACNVTGDLLPYEAVVRLAQSYEAPVLLDAAQIVGWKRLDLVELGADMVAFGGHKGLQSPWGIGGLYLSERVKMQCPTASCQLPVQAASPHPRPNYCDVGSVDQWALAGLHAAVQQIGEGDPDAHLARARVQIQQFQDTLQNSGRVRLYGSENPAERMPSLAFAIDNVPASQVAAMLRQHGITVGSGLHCAPLAHQALGAHQAGLVRISVGRGQPDDEIAEAIERLAGVLSSSF